MDALSDNAGYLKRTAHEQGFDLVGVSEAQFLNDASRNLGEWLSRGYHAGMEWIRRNPERRTDPRLVLEGARAVISLGKNYYVPVERDDASLRISRYAWGEDYHVLIGKMLDGYIEKLQSEFPVNHFKCYCDTGPVMEKAWAERAGLGWIGKHTNLINRQIGSWFFLAEVITDLDCRYDGQGMDHCGTCKACIDACPTGAIVEPYVLDSNRCISYLTIENRDSLIPEELASKLGNWVYGCDICQDVCPWNKKFQMPSEENAFIPRVENLNLKQEEVHLMTREEFSVRFHQSPVKRARFEGFMRNVRAARELPNTREQTGD